MGVSRASCSPPVAVHVTGVARSSSCGPVSSLQRRRRQRHSVGNHQAGSPQPRLSPTSGVKWPTGRTLAGGSKVS